MTKSPLPWPTDNPRARGEWDFRPGQLPETEVEWCHNYELGRIRQTELWRNHIEMFRHDCASQTYEAFWQKAQLCFRKPDQTESPSLFYTLWPEWPRKPYLSVKPKERQARIAQWRHEMFERATLEQVNVDELFGRDRYALASFRVGLGKLPDQLEMEIEREAIREGNHDVVALRIPRYGTPEETIQAFRNWLVKWRQKQGVADKELRGAGSPIKLMRADLCAVGFWRLVRSGMTRQQAVLYTQDQSGKPLFADHASAWTRAIKRAEKLLRWRIGSNFKT